MLGVLQQQLGVRGVDQDDRLPVGIAGPRPPSDALIAATLLGDGGLVVHAHDGIGLGLRGPLALVDRPHAENKGS